MARAAGVNVETIRFYQRNGLLPEPVKPYGSIRHYGEADVARVKFVKSAQRLDFSLDEAVGLLRPEDGAHCDEARLLAEQKLVDARERIESVVTRLVHDCCASHGSVSCPLIVSLHGDREPC